MKNIAQKITFDFIGNRNMMFLVSIMVIIVGLGSIVVKGGLKWGVDFAGGTLVEVRFSDPPKLDDIRTAVQKAGFANALIQRVGEENIVLIRLQSTMSGGDNSQETDVAQDEAEKIPKALEDTFGKENFVMLRVEQVGPQVGSELRRSAELAMLFTLAGLVLYISWRFESKFALPVALIAVITIGLSSWEPLAEKELALPLLILVATIAVLVVCIVFEYPFAFAAIVALIHDVLVTVGFLSLTDREMTLTVIAALLTIIGYSINDTIVVFDRIRENLHLMRHKPSYELLNASIQQTMSRTLLTALTTLMVVVVLWIMGGHVINSFASALFVGLVAGTYSSIFVATPILYVWNHITKGKIFKKA
jgi:preprotein translocase subunit SecF